MALDWAREVLGPVLGIFAEPVVYQPTVGSSYSAEGVFTEGFTSVLLTEDAPPDTSALPRLGIDLSKFLTTPQQGDTVVIRGVTYMVAEPRADSHGRMDLMLNYLEG